MKIKMKNEVDTNTYTDLEIFNSVSNDTNSGKNCTDIHLWPLKLNGH